MRRTRTTRTMRIGVLMVGLLALSACATINPQVATSEQAYIGLNAYDAAVKVGRQYLRLPVCPMQAPICRTQSLSQRVYTALRGARAAKEIISAAIGSGTPLPVTALEALQASYAVIQQIPKN